jgi:hypothetical protein
MSKFDINISSGSGAESDVKQKPEEALALVGSVSPEDARSEIVC